MQVITEYIYELLQREEVGLEKFEIPVANQSSSLPNNKKQVYILFIFSTIFMQQTCDLNNCQKMEP